MKRIGIMGGTFDPIHNAHLLIAESAREEYSLDKIFFVTSGKPPHKSDLNVTKPELRHEMVAAALDGNPYFEADDYEVRKTDYSYTADTLLHYKGLYPGADLYFIIGADSLEYLHKWRKPEVITANAVLLTYPRAGDITRIIRAARQRLKAAQIGEIHAPRFEVSSTLVRERVGEGKSIRYLVPERVAEMIERYGLYKNDN